MSDRQDIDRPDPEALAPGEEPGSDEFERMRQELIRAVRSTCPPNLANDAEDLVQEALIKVMSILRRSETPRELSSSYLWRVGYSAVIDEIRRRQRRPDVPNEQQAGREQGQQMQDADRQIGEALRRHLEGRIAPRRADILQLILDPRSRKRK